jgi:phosphoribosylglycinamide formyltransferase-1
MVNVPKNRIVFLCSGGGGNLRFIYLAIMHKLISNAEIVAVVTDRNCAANEFASSVGLPNYVVNVSQDDQSELVEKISGFMPDIIITTIHKILIKSVVTKYKNKLINLHYSLLPSFAGMIGTKPVEAAIQSGCKFSGATVHFVDESVDGGEIITQVAIPILQDDNLADAMNIIFRCGCLAVMSSINHMVLSSGNKLEKKIDVLTVLDRQCLFSGVVDSQINVPDDHFWQWISARSH